MFGVFWWFEVREVRRGTSRWVDDVGRMRSGCVWVDEGEDAVQGFDRLRTANAC